MSVKNIKFNSKPFEIIAGNKVFTENELSGEIIISNEENASHPEYLCDAGFAKWNLKYDVIKDYLEDLSKGCRRRFNGARCFFA